MEPDNITVNQTSQAAGAAAETPRIRVKKMLGLEKRHAGELSERDKAFI